MPSDFFGLQVGLSALNAARRQMEVAAQNVSNANTEGYSRQRVEIASTGASTIAAVHARTDGQGSGVSIVGTYRTIDDFLQARSLIEHSTNSQLTRSQTLLSRLELTFREPSDSAIQAQMAELWAGFEDVVNSPGNLASRSQLIQRAETLATSINQAGADMANLWTTSVEQLQTVLTGVNSTADRIAELNGSIKRATAAGLNPNALLDQRDQLAKQLAQLIGGEVRATSLGQVNIFVGGTAVVREEAAEHLEVFAGSSNIIRAYDADPLTPGRQPDSVVIRWEKDGFAANVQGGETAALLDGLNRMLPEYRAALLGPGPSSATFEANAAAGAVNKDYAAAVPPADRQFNVTLDGVTTAVTMRMDLSVGPMTPSKLQIALNDALAAAGLDQVSASVDPGLEVTLETVARGGGTTLTASALGADTTFTDVFGAAAPTATAGTDAPMKGNGLAAQIAHAVNVLHSQGVDLDGEAGGEFFAFDTVDGLSVTITDPRKLAAAGAGKPGLDGSNALSLADIANDANGPDNTYRSLIIGLGVETQTANRRLEIQGDITKQVDAARDAGAGVSIDEEMANMVAFQHTYAAASRVITAIDQMLERLINGTGLVGR